jgi:hypothetical protein
VSRPGTVVAAVCIAILGGVAVNPAAGSPSPNAVVWAPAETAKIHPGVGTSTEGAGTCTANFVFTDGKAVYLGQAAHCSATGAANETDGCRATTLPEGTRVKVAGAAEPGVIVYSSWVRMQKVSERDADTCAHNDFALVRLAPSDVQQTNPSMPVFGGPVGLRVAPTALGDEVTSYGNSSLRVGLTPLSPKYGRSLGSQSGGWTHIVYTATPGIPGDSGSGFMDSKGKALGVLATLHLAPGPGSNGVGDLAHQIAYARAHGIPKLALVNGTEPYQTSP